MKKKTNKNLLNAISVVYFLQARLFTEIFSRTSTIHQGIFLGRALCEERNIRGERHCGVSPRMSTIASRDQFKPIRIGENLVVNYNAEERLPVDCNIYICK